MKLINILTDDKELKRIHNGKSVAVNTSIIQPKEFTFMLDTFTPEWQRTLNSRSVIEYAMKHEMGELDGRVTHLIIALVREENCIEPNLLRERNAIRSFILNTQHVGGAVVKANKPITLVYTLIPCKDEKEAKEIYSKIDKQRGRTVTDDSRCLSFQTTYELTASQTSKYTAATKQIIVLLRHVGGRGYYAKSMPLRQEFMSFYNEEYHTFLGILADYGTNVKDLKDKFIEPPYLAVFLILLKDQPEKGELFLRYLLSGNNEGGTIENFIKYLKSIASSPKGGKSKSGRDYHNVISRKLILAWNAFFNSKEIKFFKVQYPNGDVDIKGTRFIEAITAIYGTENPKDVDTVKSFKDYFLDPDWKYVE